MSLRNSCRAARRACPDRVAAGRAGPCGGRGSLQLALERAYRHWGRVSRWGDPSGMAAAPGEAAKTGGGGLSGGPNVCFLVTVARTKQTSRTVVTAIAGWNASPYTASSLRWCNCSGRSHTALSDPGRRLTRSAERAEALPAERARSVLRGCRVAAILMTATLASCWISVAVGANRPSKPTDCLGSWVLTGGSLANQGGRHDLCAAAVVETIRTSTAQQARQDDARQWWSSRDRPARQDCLRRGSRRCSRWPRQGHGHPVMLATTRAASRPSRLQPRSDRVHPGREDRLCHLPLDEPEHGDSG